MCFHSGLILIHRRSLSDDGKAAELSNKLCEESAGAISSLLKTYNEQFCSSLSDPMVLHAAFTSALVHLVLLLQPNIVTYRSALKALRSTKQILLNFAATSSPASRILNDLQELATKWEIAPANSPTFWNRTSLEPNPVDLTFLDSFAPPLIG
ncbi:hypothetical protein BJY04DRAFT_116267 [Aspergillus karnatakaensis]|uniref:fungal specific transcription factor domain-containing protein n=1 Tax=Aspergillus karnatakaensis TaxID=1810916 RepID=UPI003CCD5BCB